MSCELELARFQKIKLLKQKYAELCKTYFGWERVPKSSFGRWLLEMLNYDNIDPIIPSTKEEISFNPIFNEISEDFPNKISPPLCFVNNLKDLNEYIYQYLIELDKILKVMEKNKLDLKNLNKLYLEILNLYNEENDYEKMKDVFTSKKESCTSSLKNILEPKVQEICDEIQKLSYKYALDVKNLKIKDKEVLNVSKSKQYTTIYYKNSPVKISNVIYDNLKSKIENEDLRSIWIMYKRYMTLLIDEKSVGNQAAVPHQLMDYLNENFGVDFECFASPMNSHFKNFCSAFKDTDSPFGSKGTFFEYFPKEGSFECNPPFTENVMNKMVEHIHLLLDESTGPMSFIIFLPNWEDHNAIIDLTNSNYNRKDVIAKAKEHSYRDSEQVNCFKAVHDTKIFILQNDSGFRKWKPTDSKIKNLLLNFNSS